jgi:hypothetical protein
MRKGIPNETFHAKFQELVNEKYNDHTRIYIDWSKKEEKVGYAVVADQQLTRRSIRDQSSSHHRRNAEATDNGGGRIWKQPHKNSGDQKD